MKDRQRVQEHVVRREAPVRRREPRHWTEDCRGSASRPSSGPSCRRCRATPRDRPAVRAATGAGSAACAASAKLPVPSAFRTARAAPQPAATGASVDFGPPVAEKEPRPRIGDEIRDLGGGIGGVERQEDDAGPDRAGDDGEHVGALFQLQRHPVARLQPRGDQRAGKTGSPFGEVGMADPAAVPKDQEVLPAALMPPEKCVVKMIGHAAPVVSTWPKYPRRGQEF